MLSAGGSSGDIKIVGLEKEGLINMDKIRLSPYFRRQYSIIFRYDLHIRRQKIRYLTQIFARCMNQTQEIVSFCQNKNEIGI